jgi:hypothetical protein
MVPYTDTEISRKLYSTMIERTKRADMRYGFARLDFKDAAF